MIKTFKIYTLGCKVNQYDSQSIRERFLQAGFKEMCNGKQAYFYIINTCTVTASADRKSRNIIRRCISENPRGKTIVTGCLAKKNEASLSGIEGIGYIIGKRFWGEGISDFQGRTRAFLKIQDGCNNRCSYCKVPLVRGSSRSRDMNTIVREASVLAAKGFREIVLTGICLGAYGKDLKPRSSLTGLINELEKIPALERLRLSSIEASDISDELIAKMSVSRKLCPHLHIPIQSGDNEILRLMRRKYHREDYLRIVAKIKKTVPGIAVTTDILAGFPGENENRFNNTVGLLKKINPLHAHIFPYSPREGTAAFSRRDTVDASTMRKRICTLTKAADACALKFQSFFINQKLEVLFECRIKQRPDSWVGYAGNYIKVAAVSKYCLAGQIMPVRLTGIKDGFMSGQI
ncbi:MAG: MiaB/RimO family radical SAM methylthiotransferase [Candidatus Omnitrophota bacterium]|jgi:threonylcarbamoyladenosine tRNA methylthiotransferase MtaB